VIIFVSTLVIILFSLLLSLPPFVNVYRARDELKKKTAALENITYVNIILYMMLRKISYVVDGRGRGNSAR
jgi:hypothetical protein